MKIYQTRSDYCTFCLAQLIYIVVYLLTVYGLVKYFKRNSRDGGLLNPTGTLPVSHHRPSYAQKAKSNLSPIKNPRDRLGTYTTASQMQSFTCLALTSIVQGIINWKWFSCLRRLTSDCNQWVTHCTDLTAFSCFCSKIKRHTQLIVAQSAICAQ